MHLSLAFAQALGMQGVMPEPQASGSSSTNATSTLEPAR
jgi:hypothetical protein